MGTKQFFYSLRFLFLITIIIVLIKLVIINTNNSCNNDIIQKNVPSYSRIFLKKYLNR